MKTKNKAPAKEPVLPSVAQGFNWAVPEELGLPKDQLRLRLDFYHQAVRLTDFDGDVVNTRTVSALDVAHVLASEMTFTTGFLPSDCLWWCNTKRGPVYSIYQAPKVWTLALQVDIRKPAKRFKVPLPGFVFLCTPGQPPWVYAVKARPVKITDWVYKAPLANIFADGRSCPGSHNYPIDAGQMVDSFFRSFFSSTADLKNRSVMFPDSVIHLWEFLVGKTKFPLEDLVKHGKVGDLMRQEMRQ